MYFLFALLRVKIRFLVKVKFMVSFKVRIWVGLDSI